MSKPFLFRPLPLLVLALAVLGSLAAGAWGQVPGAGGLPGAAAATSSAQLASFTNTDGTNYFALTLTPSITVPPQTPMDIVVLVDTSASQTGDFRVRALATANALMTSLRGEDSVQLMGIDLNAVSLSNGFVDPRSTAMSSAMVKLSSRVPLGSTDMARGLATAVGRLQSRDLNPRRIVYIGDGMSTANLVNSAGFADVVSQLVSNRISVISYAVGPRVDRVLLTALAGRTGGLVFEDRPETSADNAGRMLADAARGTVLWPVSATWPPEMVEVFPKTTPPLRLDRNTVLVGTFRGRPTMNLQMSVTGAGAQEQLTWQVTPGAPHDNNAYLVQVVEQARADGGISLPIAGLDSLALAKQAIDAGMRSLGELARQALDAGNLEAAERLAQGALQRDPNDPVALAVKDAVARRRQGGPPALPGAPPPAAAAAPAIGQPVAADGLDLVGAGAAPLPPAADQGAFAEAFARERKVVTAVIQTEVQNAVNQARAKMRTDPEGAAQALKLTLEKVRQAPELDPAVRDQLVDVVQAALRETARVQTEVEQRRQRAQENLATAKERQLINENLIRNQQKMKQLMDRFNSLMAEGKYRYAEEAAAQEAAQIAPDHPVPVAATLNSRAIGNLQELLAVRVAAQKGFTDTLAQVEKSHIPFSDDPPIVYPDAQIWQELTARRREKYSSMDLGRQGPAEKKISEALKSPTQLEFIETPLSDVVSYLKDYHDIEIQLDKKALDDGGVATDTPVSKNLKGISLRSALRLTLRELNLTYVIQDEVLLITTPEEAEQRLTVKVYPVADLVLPVRQSSFSGGFGGLGGYGGFGGMGGCWWRLWPACRACFPRR